MPRNWLLLLILSCFLGVGTAVAKSSNAEKLDVAGSSGEIRGVFASCSATGANGVIVYVVGRSFSALLDSDGEFTLSYVPAGIYSLAFVRNNSVITTVDSVEVRNRQRADLGEITHCPDADNDGYDASLDCNDTNPNINPGAAESCNGLDDDCDGVVDNAAGGCQTCTDADNDGYFAQAACDGVPDCNDDDPAISPAANEICDVIDNNCDGNIDEWFDADFDNYTVCRGDCDDSDPAINPVAEELCDDNIDNDCDGLTDEACGGGGGACSSAELEIVQLCLAGCESDGSDPVECATTCLGHVSGECADSVQILGLCAAGGSGCQFSSYLDLFSMCVYQECTDEWTAAFGDFQPGCPAGYANCNGQCVNLQEDSQNCGQCGSACPSGQACNQGICKPIECQEGLTNCFGNCVDLQNDPENCGQCSLYCDTGPGICEGGKCVEETDLDGDGWSPPADCDDNNPTVNPGAEELCDGIDNTCDGQVDENCQCIVGSAEPCYTGPPDTEGVGQCTAGTRICTATGTWGPCENQVLPSEEVCDGVDNNCEGRVDEIPAEILDCDVDLPDAFGVCAQGETVCEDGLHICVPFEPSLEVCDGLDNDCDGQVDEGDACL